MSMRAITTATQLILDAAFWLGGLGLAGLTLWVIISPLAMHDGGIGDVAVPVAVGAGAFHPIMELELEDTPGSPVTRAVLHSARGELRLETTSWRQQFAPNVAALLGLGVGLGILGLLRGVAQSVRSRSPFTSLNARRIRTIGLLITGLGVLVPFLEYATARAVLRTVRFEVVDLVAPFTVRGELILLGLLVLVLSSVFGHGVEIEQDRALTV
jgi:hypothetical protein